MEVALTLKSQANVLYLELGLLAAPGVRTFNYKANVKYMKNLCGLDTILETGEEGGGGASITLLLDILPYLKCGDHVCA